MADILSQEEIDALLEVVEEEGDPDVVALDEKDDFANQRQIIL